MPYYLYKYINRVPMIGNSLRQLKRRMNIYYPQSQKKAEEKALRFAGILWGAGLLGILSVFFVGKANLGYNLFLAAGIFVMIYYYVLYHMLDREEIKLLADMEGYLSFIRYRYGFHGMLEEALAEGRDKTKGAFRCHAFEICKLLELQDDEEEERYLLEAPNRHLTMFYALCKSVLVYGDTTAGNHSVFLDNMEHIRNAAMEEVLLRRELKNAFLGLLPVIMLPMFCIKLLSGWAISNVSELSRVYEGWYGFFATVCVCVVTLLCYGAVHRMRYEVKPYYKNRDWLSAVLQIRKISEGIDRRINSDYSKSIKRHRLLKECGVTENLKEFMMLRFIRTAAGVLTGEGLMIYLILMKTDWFSARLWRGILVFQILIAGIGFFIYSTQFFWISLRIRFVKKKKQEELICFQTLLLIFMHLQGISSKDILDWLVKFARYFKKSLDYLQMNFDYRGREAMEKIQEEENNRSFLAIMNGLKACDLVPVAEAFAQNEPDREYLKNEYSQDFKKSIHDRAAIAKVLAFLPIYTAIAGQLIIPFVLEGLRQLRICTQSMQTI